MSGEDDDLGVERTGAGDEDELLRALRSPGTASELAGEGRYRTLFRAQASAEATSGDAIGGPVDPADPSASAPAGGRRRAGITAARRIGIGATLALTFAAGSAGVAAAYSSQLPDPVQRVAHRLLAPIGVPAARHAAGGRSEGRRVPAASHTRRFTAPEPGRASTGPSAGVSGSARPHASADPSPTPLPTSLDPSTSPTGAMSSGAAPSDATSPPAGPASSTPTGSGVGAPGSPAKPAAVSITANGHRVAPGTVTPFAGVVTRADGSAVAAARVILQRLLPAGWRAVSSARSAADGSVSITSPPAGQSATYRFRVRGVHSHSWRLALHPTLRLSGALAARTATVAVNVSGGQAGDPVRLTVSRGGKQVAVAVGVLGSNGSATLSVEQSRARQRYVVVLPATGAHTQARAALVLARTARAAE